MHAHPQPRSAVEGMSAGSADGSRIQDPPVGKDVELREAEAVLRRLKACRADAVKDGVPAHAPCACPWAAPAYGP
eukprot:1753800-Pyramimonas_sp.AAC.1